MTTNDRPPRRGTNALLLRTLMPLLAVISIGCAAEGALWPADAWEGRPPDDLVDKIAAAGPPELLSIHTLPATEAEISDARAGRFSVVGRPADLTLPVDWHQDPYDDRSWRFWLHSLVVLEPLLQGYEATGDSALLTRAVEICLDWIEQNPLGDRSNSRFAWYDMAVPARAAYMSYLLRAAAVAGVIEPRQAVRLAMAIEEHADWLALRDNYTAGHNHGLYQDTGLYVVARQLPDHPRAGEWRRVARERFEETLRATVAVEEGMHLEHSPAYHVKITELLESFIALGIGDEKLPGLVERLRANAGWLVMPDGRHPQLGDTDRVKVEDWVLEQAAGREGLASFPDAGLGVVKRPGSYLILAAGYHGRGHKHADELTVSLYDQGRRVLVDAGRYGYYYQDPERIYAVSSRAHNGVEFAGEELVWRGIPPYGSGWLGAGEDGGWYALAADNPLLAGREISHRRLALYAPGEALVLVDRSAVPETMAVRRYLHFDPKLRPYPTEQDERRELRGSDGFRGWVCDLSPRPVELSMVEGVETPEIQGFTYPDNRVARRSPTLIFDSVADAGSGAWITVLDLTPEGGICTGRRRLALDWNGERWELGSAGRLTAIEVKSPERSGPGSPGDELEIEVSG